MANSTRQNTPPPHPRQPHVVVELADKAQGAIDTSENALKGIQFFSGSEAFREYNWLRQAPVLNASGNLRGMVVDKNARVVFNFSSNLLEKLDKYQNALVLASVIIELAKESDRVKAIAASNDSWEAKASKYSLIGSMAILRALTGTVPAAAHIVATSLEGYIGIADLATGHSKTTQKMLGGLRAADARVTSTYNQVLDADNAYHFINTHLVL